jgi:ureidoacrylate peracid hydrolase
VLRVDRARCDAAQLPVIFVADGNAALTDAEHNATLCNMATLFADVMTTEHVLAVIKASKLQGAA